MLHVTGAEIPKTYKIFAAIPEVLVPQVRQQNGGILLIVHELNIWM
jgi:hypothetical protein